MGRKEKKEGSRKWRKNNKYVNSKIAISTYPSIFTLSVKRFNAPVKRHRMAQWIGKQGPRICCLQETHFGLKDTHRLKVKK